ncbi:MAG TPA: TfoX/Sxy family protein [Cyclobacteriaceae bacterium]|nr:TfoX/Sxy family protein [Cyclobacteriaceae bacterium]
MPYNEKLADRIREALSDQRKVEEKKMFRGMCFMVNGKMCVCVSADEMMCRIDPELYESLMEKNGVRPMIHNGKTMRGFIYVSEEAMKSKKEFDFWIGLSLEYNKKAKASKKPDKKTVKKKK